MTITGWLRISGIRRVRISGTHNGVGRLNLTMDSGRSIGIDANKPPHLDYGYAMTSHSSQGQAADRVRHSGDRQ
jgi:ATP-dependent exoDNAse (exonuclease V) alpha subunit